MLFIFFFFFQAEDGIRDLYVTGVQTCALPISPRRAAGGGPGGRGRRLSRPLDRGGGREPPRDARDRKSTRLNSSHVEISYAVFCLKKKKKKIDKCSYKQKNKRLHL